MVRKAISDIRNVLISQQTEIVSIASILMILGLITKLLGLIFNSRAAGYLGTDNYNSFIFASNIPELISQVVLLGTISASILPIFATVLEHKGKERFLRVFNTVVNLSLILFILFSVIIALTGHLFLPWFIENVIHPRTPVPNSEMGELVSMMRVLMIPQIILGISIYLSTALNLYERFIVPQLAPLFYNLGRIVAIFALYPLLGSSPWVLVWGTLIGAVLHLIIQVPLITHVGVSYMPVLDINDFYIKKIGVVATPRIISLSSEQISASIDKFIAFGLIGDSLAFYSLAILIVSVPLGVVGSSFATASFPLIARAFAKNDRILAAQMFAKIVNQILFLSIPLAVLIFIMRVPLTRLTFGIFGDEVGFLETYAIAWVLLFFAPGIVFETLRTFLYRTFYAAHDTVRPLVVTFVVLILGVITGITFTNYLSHFNEFDLTKLYWDPRLFFIKSDGYAAVGGLALSSTLIFTLEAIVLIYWLNIKYLQISWKDFILPIVKKLLAGIVMMIFNYLLYKIWGNLEPNQRTLPLIVLTTTTSAASVMVYIGVTGILRVEEVDIYLKFLAKYPNLVSFKKLYRRYVSFDPIPTNV